jgi:hypothetical protein
MKKTILFLFAILPFAIAFSCKHEPIIPEQNISFATDILPIIQSSCQHSGCHDTITNEFSLTNYQEVMEEGDIEPGNPEDSKLYEAITAPDGDEDRMPQPPYNRLSEMNIRKIYIWIAQGAKNN